MIFNGQKYECNYNHFYCRNIASDKAASLASSLKINLGKIISVQESSFRFTPYDYAPGAMAVEESQAGTEISPQKVEVSASVTLAYEIK